MDGITENFYSIAANEIADKTFSKGLMAKAYSDTEGDEAKTKALYIKLRVTQLEELYKQEQKKQNEINRNIKKEANKTKKDPYSIADFLTLAFLFVFFIYLVYTLTR
jgi:hypothetical protein